MNAQRLRRLQEGWNALFAPDDEMGSGIGTASMARLFDRSPELMDAAEQVASEQRGRVLIVAQQDAQCRWLLALLRQQPPVPAFRHLAREGLFTLACLPNTCSGQSGRPATVPAEGATAGMDGAADNAPADGEDDEDLYGRRAGEDKFDLLADELLDADLALFLIAPDAGAEATGPACDTRTFARLRAAGVPVLPVLLCAAPQAEPCQQVSAQVEALRRLLGVQPVPLPWSPGDLAQLASGTVTSVPQPELLALVERMLGIRPRLAIALAQEVPFCRSMIAGRVIRTGAWITGMVGIEPIPIIDLPLQVALQWKVILQIASIYGRPGLDVRSKEMASTIGLSVALRMVTQQLVKLVPVVGWLLSGLLSGLSTLLIGHAFLRYYERDHIVDLAAARLALRQRAQGSLAPLRRVRPHLPRPKLRFLRHNEGGDHA